MQPPARDPAADHHPPAGASAALAHDLAPQLVPPEATERVLSTDQANLSVLVGDTVVVKWFREPPEAPCRSELLLGHLREVGFGEMPAFIGTATRHHRVVALLTEYLPGAVDGWDWWVTELVADPAAALASATRVGALTARLHRALATPSSCVAHPVGQGDLGDEAARGERLLAAALACTAGAAGDRLTARAHRVADAIDAVRGAGAVAVQPIHGDLHAGQILRTDDRLVVNDFDGDPLAAPAAQLLARSPLVDLAALLQSIDHVGRVAIKHHPHRADEVAQWIPAAIAAADVAYAAEWPAGAPLVHQRDALFGLRVIQELHEFRYAATSLPIWLYVPDAALTALFPDD